MIISHKHKFIFIKTEKTAGTSIEVALSKFCGDNDIITPLIAEDEAARLQYAGRGAQNYHVGFQRYTLKDWGKLLIKGKKRTFYNHIGAEEITQTIAPEVWSSYYKFCFERNPWDKVISWYYWTHKTEPRPSIKDFIRSKYAARVKGWSLYTLGDEVVVDKVGTYEKLSEELQAIAAHLNLPEELKLPRSKSNFRKDKQSYRDILDWEDKEEIAKLFSREIEYFGFTY